MNTPDSPPVVMGETDRASSRYRTENRGTLRRTCPGSCLFMFRAITKQHAMTGSRLDRSARPGQPPGFSGAGGAQAGNNEQPLHEDFQSDLD